ncbi:amino acid ABC transporter ATP-binding protein [Rhizobium sp. BK602]|uniref:amino acid ABC transporter ATP-binding protein n=1 Tax=Rhizobium sp. BK602 TaxID=2586986 RepID=UPI00160987F9|nr:amino acid ABC transporter ATP-binding protein [Rhizobium sp. BK602]MBB3612517.1 polar amino acid transport system ATP-binding protein/cystine transport system ATP-binding protein [Rhizobium sp. BK602]
MASTKFEIVTDAAPTAGRPEIKISGLRKSFDGRLVLDQVDLDVPKGKIVTIIGQSGGGKTTLMRCVNLLEQPDRGSITIGDETIFSDDKVACRDLAKLRQRVGMVFQRFNLFPHLTAVENVVLAQMHAASILEADAVKKAVELLTRVGLAKRAMAYPEQMSGGEQQRVAIARALALGPSVLLFDEPTSALDPESTGEVLRVMRELAADGMTMIIVTHELPFAKDVSDWVVFIDGGRIIEQGTAAEVLERPKEPRTAAYVARYASPG